MTSQSPAFSESADFQHSDDICDVSGITGLGYPSLELECTTSFDIIDAGHNMAKVADTALHNTVSNKVDEPMEAGSFGFDISHLSKSDKSAFKVMKSLYIMKRINFNAMWTVSSSQNRMIP